jgi:hypothetical protein
MCKVFTNQFTDDSVSEAIESLQALIQLRPEGYTEIKKIIQDVFIEVEHDSKDDREDEAYTRVKILKTPGSLNKQQR